MPRSTGTQVPTLRGDRSVDVSVAHNVGVTTRRTTLGLAVGLVILGGVLMGTLGMTFFPRAVRSLGEIGEQLQSASERLSMSI